MTGDRWLLAWGSGSVALGAGSLLLPLYFVSLDGGAVGLGLLAGVGAAAGAPGAILAGRFADRTGRRRPVVLSAIALAAAVMAVSPFVRTAGILVLANGVLWFAAGAAAPVLTLLVTAGHEEEAWSERFATLNAYGGWGWAGGLVLGTVWTTMGGVLGAPAFAQRTLFFACAVAAVLGLVLGWRWLPHDGGTPDRPTINGASEAAITDSILDSRRTGIRSATFPVWPSRVYWLTRSIDPRRFVDRLTPSLALYFLAVTATFVGFGAFWGPLPLYLRDLGYSSGGVFSFYLVSSIGSALCYGISGRLATRYDPPALNGAALAGRALLQPGLAAVGLLTAATAVGLVGTGATFVLIGVAWAVIAVTAALIVTALAPAAIRGQALGLYTAVSGIASGVGAVLGGWLASRDFLIAFGVSGTLVLVGAGVVVALWRRRETTVPKPAASATAE